MERAVSIGAVLLVAVGVLHAIHVARADDVEPYLWVGSIFLVLQGVITLVWMRRSIRGRL